MGRKKKEVIKEEPFNYGGLIVFVLLAVLIFFSIKKYGIVGTIINNIFNFLIGPYYLAVLITCFVCAFINVFLSHRLKFTLWFYIGLVILNIAICLLAANITTLNKETITISYVTDILKSFKMLLSEEANFGGGVLGTLLLFLCIKSFDTTGTIIILVVLFMLAALLIVPLGVYKTIMNNVKASGVKIKEKSNAFIEDRRSQRARMDEERQAKELQEEENRQRLQKEIRDIFSSNLSEEIKEQTTVSIPEDNAPIERVDNVSEFSKTYFIKDDLANEETASEPILEPSKQEEKPIVKVENPHSTKVIPKSKGKYQFPPVSLLNNVTGKPSKTNEDSARVKGEKLIETLSNFGIEAKLVDTHIGPSVTKFEIKPEQGVKVNKIINIESNIKMALQAKTIRIEAPIPGRDVVGVEIPNAETVMVRMSELMKNVPTKYKNSPLTFALGKDLLGSPVYCELNKMPHLLIAGATGSGKSVCMNTIITSFLLRTDPKDLKIVLVDPKKVEFTPYHDIPHLLWPVITDANMASMMLKKAVVIMEERYDAFASAEVRNIADYNAKVEEHNNNLKEGKEPMKKMPYIAIIIDELADLMVVAKKEVESSIQRLTQLSRACGMHLIVATQRPSTDVITGLIKSNIPSRISFAVSSSIDSRTILDQTGAEKLLGYGDMLYYPTGEPAPIRVQGCFVKDEEIKSITDYAKKQAQPEYDDTYFEIQRNSEGSSEGFSFNSEGKQERDALYDEVVEFVTDVDKASTSLLQRRFGIGYNRAARIIDQLEDNGIIGHANGSKPREVYHKKEDNQEWMKK